MNHHTKNHHAFRGLLQSEDGVITRVLKAGRRKIVFETAFGLRGPLAGLLKEQPEHLLFSERSRIARLGVQIESAPAVEARAVNGRAVLTLEASSVIPGYPGLDELKDFFSPGLQVGRLVYCDPEALLSSEEVLEAVERSELKLPASAAISSDGSVVIAPHKIACRLKQPLTKDVLGRILLREDGREVLNRYQVRHPVPAVAIAPGEGLVTTCSMYLNEHFVVLQSGFSLGRNLAATVLDPIKTRGIRIYLEIINQSEHPIVNPLITAKIYRAARRDAAANGHRPKPQQRLSYGKLAGIGRRFRKLKRSNCHFIDRPIAVVPNGSGGASRAEVFLNGPEAPCDITHAMCALARRDFSSQSRCRHRYATGRLSGILTDRPAVVIAKYFPNLIEHRDLVNLTCDGKIEALYFMEPSCEHGPFLSQMDHNRLQEYHAFGLDVYWACQLNRRRMVHTMRDGMGYFVAPERLAALHGTLAGAPEGAALTFTGPHGYFTFKASPRSAVFVATGTGVAPFRSMAAAGVSGFTLLHGVEQAEELYYHNFLKTRAAAYVACLSGGRPAPVAHHAGRVTGYIENRLPRRACDFYLCGRQEMIRDATLLIDEGFQGSLVYSEAFY